MGDRVTMVSDAPLDVLVYGLGAIGSFYAFILSRSQNIRLTVCGRSNYEIVKAQGLQFKSIVHGNHVIKFDKVLKSPAEARRTFDYVVCAHKAVDEDNSAGSLASVIDAEKSTVIIIQNGIGIEEPFRKTFPSATIISAVTWTGAKQTELGIVQHLERWEGLQIGLFPGPASDATLDEQRLHTFAALLEQGGTKFDVVPDIQQIRWKKVVSNAVWNPITTLTQLDSHTWLDSSAAAAPLTRRLMVEVVGVAAAAGVRLEPDLPDVLMRQIRDNVAVGSSMLNDYVAGKPMEVEPILGQTLRRARELGVDTPVLETFYALLTAINGRLKGTRA